MPYVDGDTVKLTCTFTVDGTPTAPTAVELKVKHPDDTVDTYSSGFTNPSTGVYSKNITVDEAGVWHYRWTGTGTAPGVEEGRLTVEASQVV